MKTVFYSLSFLLLVSMNTVVHAAAESISKQQAIDIALQSHPGRVLGVKRKADVYQVKTLNDSGKIHVVKIDARTGKLLSGHGVGQHSGR